MGAVQSAETGSGRGRYISGDVCVCLSEGSETSAYINRTPGNYPKGNLLYSVHGESLKFVPQEYIF